VDAQQAGRGQLAATAITVASQTMTDGVRTDWIDVCGQTALSQIERRLNERGYQLAHGVLAEGLFTWHVTDAAPGWTESIYMVTVALRDGDEIQALIEGLF
jgi:hypothetical protein